MPKRTNPRQQIIELLKELLAGPGCEVTASKLLTDAVTGLEREVDVVAEYSVDGDDTYVQAFEVADLSRPLGVPRLEQLLKKHERLPTDRLIVVSWKGFTGTAGTLAKTHPHLLLVVPEAVEGPDGPQIKALFADTVRLSPRKVVLTIRTAKMNGLSVNVEPDHALYDSTNAYLGPAIAFASDFLQSPAAMQLLIQQAHNHPDREDLGAFVIGAPLPGFDVYLREDILNELHHVVGIEVTGAFTFEQQHLDLEVRTFMNNRFGHGNTVLVEEEHVVVATLDEEQTVKSVSIRRAVKGQTGT